MLTKRALNNLLADLKTDLLKNGLSPQAMILYGSYSNGGVHKYSDIDVALWSHQFSGDILDDFEKAKPVLKKYAKVQAKLYPSNADENNFDPFIEVIKRTGVKIL